MAMQEMRGCFYLQTTSTQRFKTALKVMIKSVFIKMTSNSLYNFDLEVPFVAPVMAKAALY